MRKHIFNEGPSITSISIKKVSKAALDLDGIGMSILEISHRSKEFDAIINEAVELMKELMNIPEGLPHHFRWWRCVYSICYATNEFPQKLSSLFRNW